MVSVVATPPPVVAGTIMMVVVVVVVAVIELGRLVNLRTTAVACRKDRMEGSHP